MLNLTEMAKLMLWVKDEEEAKKFLKVTEEQIFNYLSECGEFIKLPRKCKIGDSVYFIIEDIDTSYIYEQKITRVCSDGFYVSSEEDEPFGEFVAFSEEGKTVFFDFKSAEDKLNFGYA